MRRIVDKMKPRVRACIAYVAGRLMPWRALYSAVLIAVLTAPAFGQNRAFSADMVAAASKSVVLLKGVTDSGTVLGSGFLISSDGQIATNLHVVREMKSGSVRLASGEVYDNLMVLAFDDRKDLAIVKIAGFDLPAIELGNSNEVQPGEPVMAIGSPDGLQGTITAGVVSAIREDPFSGGYKVIQTDAASNPGNSGGPLLNNKGQVIGVITSRLQASQGLNFAVPINYVRGLRNVLGKPMTLADFRAAVSATPVDVFNTAESFPTNWISITTGMKFKIRTEPDVVYVEGVLSDAVRQNGTFTSVELHKASNGYSGKVRVVIAGGCRLEYPAEASVFSPSRIEIRFLLPPVGSKFNPKKCAYDKAPAWRDAVWIPE
ncbi:MAG: trypsin-like peptidase domain-containing protein [Bryobacteraceae bacterium]